MISFYDLLSLLKNNKHPKEVKLHLCDKAITYVYNKDNGSYLIKYRNQLSQVFDMYLRDCLLDSSSFDNIIEIVK